MPKPSKRAILLKNGKPVSDPLFIGGVESAQLILSHLAPLDIWSVEYKDIEAAIAERTKPPESDLTFLYMIRIATVSTTDTGDTIIVKFDPVPDNDTLYHLKSLGFKWRGGKLMYWYRPTENLNDTELRGVLSGAVAREEN